MVFAVQCPNPKCKKYMLVEDQDRNKVVPCLICKAAIRLGTSAQGQSPVRTSRPTPPPKRD
jgi:hypothetical protein